MYLQSLEIIGFKSFAPKTVLNFHRGVTCVVGPNGCGKSNVLDAIIWVLGEQSAKALRGGEMTDVIFSGTDSRAALGMAEVSMTFAECEKELGLDWNEVTITRRVFREGGSEYLLNRTPCRLRDIQNLFMDTGIGRSAYSIMQQGKIDAILSSKAEDRRQIFEEAAGITRFKSQKKEALRKLEATEANLLRLEDIVKEVKRQIGSLQRQAGKARRYQALVSELKTLETHNAKRQWDAFEQQRTAGRDRAGGAHRAAGAFRKRDRAAGKRGRHPARGACRRSRGRSRMPAAWRTTSARASATTRAASFSTRRRRVSSAGSSSATDRMSRAAKRSCASPRRSSTRPTPSWSKSPPCSRASCAGWRRSRPPSLRVPASGRKPIAR